VGLERRVGGRGITKNGFAAIAVVARRSSFFSRSSLVPEFLLDIMKKAGEALWSFK